MHSVMYLFVLQVIASKRHMTRRSTLPVEEELEAATKYMKKQISRTKRQQMVEEGDEESTTVSSTICDSDSPKRLQLLMCDLL